MGDQALHFLFEKDAVHKPFAAYISYFYINILGGRFRPDQG